MNVGHAHIYIKHILSYYTDDFEKEYPDFDWRNTPDHKHVGGVKKCPCPKHEHIREQIKYARIANKTSKKVVRPNIYNLCLEHYAVFFEEAIPNTPFTRRLFSKFAIKTGLVKITKLTYMESERCFYCKFGSGGYDKKNELPPV